MPDARSTIPVGGGAVLLSDSDVTPTFGPRLSPAVGYRGRRNSSSDLCVCVCFFFFFFFLSLSLSLHFFGSIYAAEVKISASDNYISSRYSPNWLALRR